MMDFDGRAHEENNHDIVRRCLSDLLASDSNDAFVVFEDPFSGKFVQVAGSATEPLLVDLPSQPLDAEECERAVRLFRAYGAELEAWEVLDEPGGNAVGEQTGFQVVADRDIELAAQIIMRVFHEVYGLPADFDMHVDAEI
jgi:hypothetical protein